MHFGASSYALCVRNDLLIYAGHLRECISFCFVFVTYYVTLNRSSRWQIFLKIGALKNLAIFTRKHLCWSFFNYVSGSVAASDWSEIHFEKIFILILIKLKHSLLQTVAINLIFLPLNNLDSSYNCISFFPMLKYASAAEAYSVPCQLSKTKSILWK